MLDLIYGILYISIYILWYHTKTSKMVKTKCIPWRTELPVQVFLFQSSSFFTGFSALLEGNYSLINVQWRQP